MGRGKKHTPEQIVNFFGRSKWRVANGKTTPAACERAGITEQTYYRWRKEYRRSEGGPGEAAERAGAGEREAEAAGG